MEKTVLAPGKTQAEIRMKDNTTTVDMIDPAGNVVPITVSPRHLGNRSVDYYRSKGFKTVHEYETEKAREDEMAELRRQRDEARAALAAAGADKPTGGKKNKANGGKPEAGAPGTEGEKAGESSGDKPAAS